VTITDKGAVLGEIEEPFIDSTTYGISYSKAISESKSIFRIVTAIFVAVVRMITIGSS